ncbi:MAG: DUF2865 domain-containing protein, partial [Beijerinckiaceae bacterium]
FASRVDPRLLLNGVRAKANDVSGMARAAQSSFFRTVAICVAGVIGLSSFGAVVVRANDDSGVMAFIRQESRPLARRAPAPAAAPVAYPVGYYIPAPFRATRKQTTAPQAPIAAYAPFGQFFPMETVNERIAPRRRAASAASAPRVRSVVASTSDIEKGGRIAYCVRTCDGFFFPVNTSGSDRADDQACARMCPAAETKVYFGRVGEDMDQARAREGGRKYSALPAAFRHRSEVSNSCSCTAQGFGVANTLPAYRDQMLRPGDVVMTRTGMRVFTGGSFPYREANFTTIERSGAVSAKARDQLRAMERASLPGRSGVAVSARRRTATEDLDNLVITSRKPANAGQLVRYLGPSGAATP